MEIALFWAFKGFLNLFFGIFPIFFFFDGFPNEKMKKEVQFQSYTIGEMFQGR